MTGLSAQQQGIVDSKDGVVMVIAGPGSGKTRVLTYRVKRALDDGVDAGSILLLTFTNKAAKNMISRLEAMLGHKPAILGGTFHHVANRFLRRHASKFGYRDNYTIIDAEDSVKLVRDVVKTDFEQYAKNLPKPEKLYRIFSYCRNSRIGIQEYLKTHMRGYREHGLIMNKIHERYTERKIRSNIMDFDDLLVYLNSLLDDNEFLDKFRSTYTHIFVDEFQDTNRLQFEIVSKMHRDGNLLFVVGDDCQSIYSFRAAEIKNMLRFTDKFGSAKIFYLTENYRSTSHIVSLVNTVIQHNRDKFDKQLVSINKNSRAPLPRVLLFDDLKTEADRVAGEIAESISAGARPEDISVLYRSNFHSAYIEMSLANRGIKYVRLGGLRFFEQAHIKDIIAFLKIADGMTDELAWSRLLKMFKGVGEKTAKKIFAKVCNAERPLAVLKEISDPKLATLQAMLLAAEKKGETIDRAKIFYEQFYRAYVRENFGEDVDDRVNDILQLFSILSSYTTFDEFLEDSMLDANLADAKDTAGCVTLSTIHQAKGLEWETVFVVGVSQGWFPSKHSLEDSVKLEEERRLFYVACSRARNSLIITAPLSSGAGWEGSRDMQVSQFISELPEDKYEMEWVKKQYSSDFVSADTLL